MKPYAFTGSFPVFRNRIVSPVMLRSPREGDVTGVKVRALWDTGCSSSLISQRVASFLDLPLSGSGLYRSPFGGERRCELATAKIYVVLDGCSVELNVGVTENPNSDKDCDLTLGLDFITKGDFALTHDGEQLVFSFCYPPLRLPLDYTDLRPRLENVPVAVEKIEIDEGKAVESRLSELTLIEYFKTSRG